MNECFPIDAVYLWCDGDDPAFKKEKEMRQREVGYVLPPNSVDALLADYLSDQNRYESHDELKYSLRSLEKCAPWVNHIYIVTNKQKPKWLKETERLTIVDHSEFIPKDLLPTFNSATIEQYIINIKGLAEHFIFLNDDMFFYRETPKEIFFERGKPIVYTREPWKRDFVDTKSIREAQENTTPYIKSVLNGYRMMCEHRGTFVDFCLPTHSIDAYSKSILKAIFKEYPETYERNVHPFRNTDEIVRAFWILEMAYFHGCSRKIDKAPKSLIQRFLAALGLFKTYTYEFQSGKKTYERFVKDMERVKPYHFCCNNLSGKKAERTMKYLQNLFPEKSSFEI